jgi:hypothetical protein
MLTNKKGWFPVRMKDYTKNVVDKILPQYRPDVKHWQKDESTYKIPPIQMFLVPSNLAGKLFVYLLRRFLNRARYTITVRGRVAKDPELRGYFGDVKQKDAKKLGVYIRDRYPHRRHYEYDSPEKRIVLGRREKRY